MHAVRLGYMANLAHHAEISDALIGKRSSVGRYTKIRNAEIGNYCSISWNVTVGALEHPTQSVSMHAFSYKPRFGLCTKEIAIPHKQVSIGHDVWIGCEAVIMPGVRIGNGAIIGAGAVVTHDVLPYEVVAGVPAKHVRDRFAPKVKELLEASAWWFWNDEAMKRNMRLFSPEAECDEKLAAELAAYRESDPACMEEACCFDC